MDFIIDHVPARFSDLLAGEKKACDEIVLKSHNYFYSKLCYLMVHRNSSMPTVEMGLPDTVRTKKRPRQREGAESVSIIIKPL